MRSRIHESHPSLIGTLPRHSQNMSNDPLAEINFMVMYDYSAGASPLWFLQCPSASFIHQFTGCRFSCLVHYKDSLSVNASPACICHSLYTIPKYIHDRLYAKSSDKSRALLYLFSILWTFFFTISVHQLRHFAQILSVCLSIIGRL